MAATNSFPPKLVHSLHSLLFILTFLPPFCQSNPQNIQTFYTLSPPVINHPPLLTPTTPSRSSPKSTTAGKVIGVTVGSTIVVSGLVFLILRHRSRKRAREASIITTTIMSYQNDNFMRFDGNIKGLIVDENGLDVMYWRKLEEGERMSSLKKQNYKSLKDAQEEEEKHVISQGRIQEAPLLTGKSSTSQSPIWDEKHEVKSSVIPKNSLPPPPVLFHHKDSYKFDGDIMEALFGYIATNRKSPRNDTKSSVAPSQVFILDKDKSQSTATVLQSLGISRKEIIDALVGGKSLQRDAIEKLTSLTPTDEESAEILAYDGDPTRLSYAESFMYHLLKTVPSAFTRFKLMLLRSNYETEFSQLKVSLLSIELACEELKNEGLLLKLLNSILKAGSRLNANTQALSLSAVKKLSDVMSTDGKTTLLQFVLMELIRSEGKRCLVNTNRKKKSDNSVSKDETEREYMMFGLPVIGCLSADLFNVKKLAVLNYEILVKTNLALVNRVVEITNVVKQCGPGGFVREIRGFLDKAELEMKVVEEERTRVMGLVEKTRNEYGCDSNGSSIGESGNRNPLEIFVLFRDFLGMVDEACIDIARYVQERATGTGSSSPGFQTIFRFHKLPSDFLSNTS